MMDVINFTNSEKQIPSDDSHFIYDNAVIDKKKRRKYYIEIDEMICDPEELAELSL